MPKSNHRRYGYIRDYKDIRDSPFTAIKKKGISIPDKVNLWKQQSPVEDQGNLGSCVGQALVGALEFLLLEKAKKTHTLRKVRGVNYYDLSPLFTYYNARRREGTVKIDAGTQIRSAIKSLAEDGACREDMWPYIISKYADKPSVQAYTEAKAHKITSYYRLNGHDDMVTCLAEGFPFVYGITVYSSFESGNAAKTGIIEMPKRYESMVGGHAMLCTGYDKKTEMFDFKNSWDGWGANNTGYGKLPFNYMQALSNDSWTIRV